jgi:hypothetical protein
MNAIWDSKLAKALLHMPISNMEHGQKSMSSFMGRFVGPVVRSFGPAVGLNNISARGPKTINASTESDNIT